jgi:hypothetical protein
MEQTVCGSMEKVSSIGTDYKFELLNHGFDQSEPAKVFLGRLLQRFGFAG